MRERIREALGSSRRHRGHHQRGNLQRGRIWVVIIFFILLCALAMTYLDVAVSLGSIKAANSYMGGSAISSLILTTGLLAGIWCRQNWARYTLVTILALRVFAAFVGCATIFKNGLGFSVWCTTFLMGAADSICAWALISSRDIQRLTNKIQD